jgi:hypothetical protein
MVVAHIDNVTCTSELLTGFALVLGFTEHLNT